MKKWLKRIGIGLVAVIAILLLGAGGYAYALSSAYDESMGRVYDVPLPKIERSTDAVVLARGKHLAEAVGACVVGDCHGKDLSGGKLIEFGPVGSLAAPNITTAGLGAAYSDGELARLLRHGIKKDGRSVLFMPAQEFNWLPDSDLVALISYVRTFPPVARPNQGGAVKILGKVLDRNDALDLDVARRIDHQHIEMAPPPTPTAAYGRFLGKMCMGCHGKTLSGGPIPGAPPSIPIPSNITPHETGLRGWSYEDFDRLLREGARKNGKKLDPFMPIEAFGKLDEVEKHALYAFLMSRPALPFGGR